MTHLLARFEKPERDIGSGHRDVDTLENTHPGQKSEEHEKGGRPRKTSHLDMISGCIRS
jgi:hypothetical protein